MDIGLSTISFNSFFDSLRQGEEQITESFTRIWSVVEEKISSLETEGSTIQREIVNLFSKIDVTEECADKEAADHEAEIANDIAVLAGLKERVDTISSEISWNDHEASMVLCDHRRLEVKENFCVKDASQRATKERERINVMTSNDAILANSSKEYLARKKVAMDRIRSAQAVSKRLEAERVELQKDIEEFTQKYSNHGHSTSYRSMGNWSGAGSGRPNK